MKTVAVISSAKSYNVHGGSPEQDIDSHEQIEYRAFSFSSDTTSR